MDTVEAARTMADAVSYLPAGFMMAGRTYERGGELGFEGMDFYTAGRGGALGDVDSPVVTAVLYYFNPDAVHQAWERSRPVMPRREAARAFASCLVSWALARMPDDVDCDRLAELAGRVNAHADVAGAPLFAAWREMPEPVEPKALALHRLNVLRELRGAVHGSAVIASGLEPLEAVMVRTPQMAGVFGWSEPYPEVETCRDAWERAEDATNKAMARAYGALDARERAELVELALAAHERADRTPRRGGG